MRQKHDALSILPNFADTIATAFSEIEILQKYEVQCWKLMCCCVLLTNASYAWQTSPTKML